LPDEDKPDNSPDEDEFNKKKKFKDSPDEDEKDEKKKELSDDEKSGNTLLFIIVSLLALFLLVSSCIFAYLAYKSQEEIAALKKAVETLERQNQVMKELRELRDIVNQLEKNKEGSEPLHNSSKISEPYRDTKKSAHKPKKMAAAPLPSDEPPVPDNSYEKKEIRRLHAEVNQLRAERTDLKKTVKKLREDNAKLAAIHSEKKKPQVALPRKRAGPENQKSPGTVLVHAKKERPRQTPVNKKTIRETKKGGAGIRTDIEAFRRKSPDKTEPKVGTAYKSHKKKSDELPRQTGKNNAGILTKFDKTRKPVKSQNKKDIKKDIVKLLFINRPARVLSGQILIKLLWLSKQTASLELTLPRSKIIRFRNMKVGMRRPFECKRKSYFFELAAIGSYWARVKISLNS